MSDLPKAPTVTGDVFRDLHNMHSRFGFHDQRFDVKALMHRIGFLREELEETEDAAREGDAAKVLDGLIDLVVVAVGTIDLAGADGHGAWKAVMDANNAKQVGFNESRPDSEGVDLIKPEGWTPPDVYRFIGKLNEILAAPPAVREDFFNKLGYIGFDRSASGDSMTLGFTVPNYEYKDGDTIMINGVLYTPKASQQFGKDRAAVRILEECISLMRGKSQDYQSEVSSVRAADYYPNGIDDLVYMIDVLKRLRMISVLENMKHGGSPNFDSLVDILKDRIVYLALALEFIEGTMDGRIPNTDIWNRKVSKTIGESQDN